MTTSALPGVGADEHIGPRVALSKIGKVVYGFTKSIPGIAHFAIMPNHVHMILRISATDPKEGPMWSSAPTEASYSSIIRTWKTLITKQLGHSIWQRSFYDRVIRNEEEYNSIVQYIDENPKKWAYDDYYVP